MDELIKTDRKKSSSERNVDNRFANERIVVDRPHSELAKRPENSVNSVNTQNESNDNETNSMRVILPVFIENEQKYAQHDRKRKIQSSPAKSMHRIHQDSSSVERQLHVSWMTINRNGDHYRTKEVRDMWWKKRQHKQITQNTECYMYAKLLINLILDIIFVCFGSKIQEKKILLFSTWTNRKSIVPYYFGQITFIHRQNWIGMYNNGSSNNNSDSKTDNGNNNNNNSSNNNKTKIIKKKRKVLAFTMFFSGKQGQSCHILITLIFIGWYYIWIIGKSSHLMVSIDSEHAVDIGMDEPRLCNVHLQYNIIGDCTFLLFSMAI